MFYLNIVTDNAAFEGDNLEPEIARILRKVADKLERGIHEGTERDINGNTVADWNIGR